MNNINTNQDCFCILEKYAFFTLMTDEFGNAKIFENEELLSDYLKDLFIESHGTQNVPNSIGELQKDLDLITLKLTKKQIEGLDLINSFSRSGTSLGNFFENFLKMDQVDQATFGDLASTLYLDQEKSYLCEKYIKYLFGEFQHLDDLLVFGFDFTYKDEFIFNYDLTTRCTGATDEESLDYRERKGELLTYPNFLKVHVKELEELIEAIQNNKRY